MSERLPPDQRPTAQQLQAMANGEEPIMLAGQPATKCPRCSAVMFVNKTMSLATRVDRYETCRVCDKTYLTRQPQKVFVREISSGGNELLSIHRESA